MKRFIAFLFLLVFLNGCIVEEPRIDIADIKLDGISEGKINLKIVLDVYNPNSFAIKVKYIEYNLFYDKNLFSTGVWEGDEKLNPNTSNYIPIVISLEEGIIMKFISLILKGKTQEIQNKINIEGKAILNKFGKNFTYNFKWKYKDKKESQHEKKIDIEPIH